MYFEIENSPVNAAKTKKNEPPHEELHILKLVPFSPTPTIAFDGVPVGRQAASTLHISNPRQQALHVSVQKRPDQITGIALSWDSLTVPPNQTVPLQIIWTPGAALSSRTVLHVCDNKKGKYDVPVLCKAIDLADTKKNKQKKFVQSRLKKSPFKTTKKPKSPKLIADAYIKKPKQRITYETVRSTFVNDSVTFFKSPPFQSKSSINLNSKYAYTQCIEESNVRRETYLVHPRTNKENYAPCHNLEMQTQTIDITITPENVKKGPLSAIDNFEFTPLKSLQNYGNIHNEKNESLYRPNSTRAKGIKSRNIFQNEHVPTINLIDSDTSFDFAKMIEMDEISHTFNYLKVPSGNGLNHSVNNSFTETFDVFKMPDSIEDFDPERCSTEKKMDRKAPILCANLTINVSLEENDSSKNLSSRTYTKSDSPIVPLDPTNNDHLQSSPYSRNLSPKDLLNDFSSKLVSSKNCDSYTERVNLRQTFKEKNNFNHAKDIIEANLWQKSPPRVIGLPLSSIPEEQSETYSETTFTLKVKPAYSETFVLDKTFEKNNPTFKYPAKTGWSKTNNRDSKLSDPDLSEIRSKSDSNFSKPLPYEVDVYSLASVVDPFMASTCLYDQEAYDKLEIEFKSWLNYLLTPPSELDTKLEIEDIGKAWAENRSKSIPAAPTKEQVSSKYTSHRLDSLRKSATALISSNEMSQVFIKVSNQVERKILAIRSDKNLHLDIGLQKMITRLLLCYNPLWLRIGLEAVYGKVIPLSSNNDIWGLSEFIVEHMFKDPYINSKYMVLQSSYSESIKKFTLKKFLFLVYFLDQAKEKKLIFHDPCLFCRNAAYKESKQILFQFTKELLSGVGDITKHLRPLGYVVNHKQLYIHEFKYAVHNLAIDLKDGVRLTRLMEIILMKDDLVSKLRTPAISRLQKVHNAQIALNALASENFIIVGDITAKDIADGHREKTLSLIWQLINKFRAPLFENAAITIQKWWRRHYLKVWVKNRIEMKRKILLNTKAVLIQSWWRSVLCRRWLSKKRCLEQKASIVIQSWWKKIFYQHRFISMKAAVIKIELWYKQQKDYQYRRLLNTERELFLLKKSAAVTIQIWYRKMKIRHNLRINNQDRPLFLLQKSSVIKIQNWYRKTTIRRQMKIKNTDRPHYLLCRKSSIIIQQWYRKIKLHQQFINYNEDYRHYVLQKKSILKIQKWFRSQMLQKTNYDRPLYLSMQASAVLIQNWYRKKKLYQHLKSQNEDRPKFLLQKSSAIKIQTWYRHRKNVQRLKLENQDRPMYLLKKASAVVIQKWYRKRKQYFHLKMSNKDRPLYLLKRSSVIKIQVWYRKKKLQQYLKSINIERPAFLLKKASVVIIQKWYREVKLRQILKSQNTERPLFLKKKASAIVIQKWYRKMKILEEMKRNNIDRPLFLNKKMSVITIQCWYRKIVLDYNLKLQNKDRPQFLKIKASAVVIQRWYRKRKLIEKLKSQNVERSSFLLQKASIIKIQVWYRDIKVKENLAKQNFDRPMFLRQKTSAITIQHWYRKIKIVHQLIANNTDRPLFLLQKASATRIQLWYRMIQTRKYLALSNTDRSEFLLKKYSAIKIQRWYLLMKRQQDNVDRPLFLLQKSSVIIIQKWYRRQKICQKLRNENMDRRLFLSQKESAVLIQTWYRMVKVQQKLKANNKDRPLFLVQRTSAIKIQNWYRVIYQSRTMIERVNFLHVRQTTINVQRIYRAKIAMKKEREQYLYLKKSTIVIQRYYRSYVESKIIRKEYLKLRMATVFIQQKFRAKLQMKLVRNEYFVQRNACITIQRMFRLYSLVKSLRQHYLRMKHACICIQNYYKNYLIMKRDRESYLEKRQAILSLQSRYRAYRDSKSVRADFLLKRNAAIKIQRMWRASLSMRLERRRYLTLRQACILIQRLVREKHLRLQLFRQKVVEVKAATKIQAYWKGYILRKNQSNESGIKKLRERWQNGGLQSTQSTLAERNDDALDVISSLRDYASIIRAFKTLDFITNVYPMMYTVDEVKRICKSLMLYMDASNRSISALETLRLAVAILANLARYKDTAPNAYHISYVKTILTLMTRWCENDNILSLSLCTLLWLYAKKDVRVKEEISTYLKKADSYKILCKVRISIIRKKKMDNQRKINKSMNSSSLMFSTPVKTSKSTLIKYPMVKPDYGISKPSSPRYFLEETDAINEIFLTFDLPFNVFKPQCKEI